jgi:hypothetical protein
MLACYKARAVPVNVNYRYVADELQYLCDDADLVALFHDDDTAPHVAAVTAPLLRLTVVAGSPEYEALVTSGAADRAQREREWASQGLSKNKASGEKDKFIRHYRKVQTEQLAGRAARTEKAIERLEVADKPREAWQLRFEVGAAGRSGDDIASASSYHTAPGSRPIPESSGTWTITRRAGSPGSTSASVGANLLCTTMAVARASRSR